MKRLLILLALDGEGVPDDRACDTMIDPCAYQARSR